MIKSAKTSLLLVLALALSGTPVKAQTLSLEQCINFALTNNRTVKIAKQDVLMADDKHAEAINNLFPKLNGVADYRYYTDLPYQLMPTSVFGGPAGTYKEVQFGVPKNLNANLQLSIPIFNANILNAIQTTRIASELSEVQQMKTEEDVVLEVSNTYYNAQILLNQLAFLDSNIINTTKLVKSGKLLYEHQMARETDVGRLELQLEQLNTQRTTVFNQYQQVLNVLKFLTSRPLADTIAVTPGNESNVSTNFEIHIPTDIKLMELKQQFTHSELNGLKYLRLPSLSAYGLYGKTGLGNTGSNSFFNYYPVSYIGVQLTVPLFNGYVTQRKINQKKIELAKTTLQKDLIVEKNNLERKNTELQFQVMLKNVETITRQIELAKSIYNNTILQQQQGIANITDVILADTAVREAQQSYITALVNLRKAELEYKKVTGNLIK
jgi:OMF family outer membrane factor